MDKKLREKITDLKLRNKKHCILVVRREQESVNDFIDRIASNLSDGADVIFLSGKNLTDREFIDCATKSKQLCEMFEATFIVESRVDIAYLAKADGVNLNQEDIDIRSVREFLGEEFFVGLYSNTPEDVLFLVKGGADYISVNQIPSTPTEPVNKTGLEYAKWVSENTFLPILVREIAT